MVNAVHLCRILLNLKILRSGCSQLCQGACAVSTYGAPQQQFVLTVPIAQAPLVPGAAQVYQPANRGCCQPTVSWINQPPWNNMPGYLTPANNGSQVTYQNAIYNAPSNPNIQKLNFTFVTQAPVYPLNVATTTTTLSTTTNLIYTIAPFQYSTNRLPNNQNTGLPFVPVVIPTNYPTTQDVTTQRTFSNQTQFATAKDNYNRGNANYTNPVFRPVVLPGSQGQSTVVPQTSQVQSTTDNYNNANSNYTQTSIIANLGENNGVGESQTSNYNNPNSGYVQQQGGQTIDFNGVRVPVQGGQTAGGAIQQVGNPNSNYNQVNAGFNVPQSQLEWNGISSQNDNVYNDPNSGYHTASYSEFDGTYVQNQQQNDFGTPIITPSSQLNHPNGMSSGQRNMGLQQGQNGPSGNYNQANSGFSQNSGDTRNLSTTNATGQRNMNAHYNQVNAGYQQGENGNYNQVNAGFPQGSGISQGGGAGVASGQISAQEPAVAPLNDQGNFNMNDAVQPAYNNGNTNYNLPASNGNSQSSASSSSGIAGALTAGTVATGAGASATGVASNGQFFYNTTINPNGNATTTPASIKENNNYSTNYPTMVHTSVETSTSGANIVHPVSLNPSSPVNTTFAPSEQKQMQEVTGQTGNVFEVGFNDATAATNLATNSGDAVRTPTSRLNVSGISGTSSITPPNVAGSSSIILSHGDMNYQYTKNVTETPHISNASILQTNVTTAQDPEHIVNTSLNSNTDQSSSSPGFVIANPNHDDMNYQYSKNITESPSYGNTGSNVMSSPNSGIPGTGVTEDLSASTVSSSTTGATSSIGLGGTQTFPGLQNDDSGMGQQTSNPRNEVTGDPIGTGAQYDHTNLNTEYGQYWSTSSAPMVTSGEESSSDAIQRDDPNRAISESFTLGTTPQITNTTLKYAAMSQVSYQVTSPFIGITFILMLTLF